MLTVDRFDFCNNSSRHHEWQYGADIALTEPQPSSQNSGTDYKDDNGFRTHTNFLNVEAEVQNVFTGKNDPKYMISTEMVRNKEK